MNGHRPLMQLLQEVWDDLPDDVIEESEVSIFIPDTGFLQAPYIFVEDTKFEIYVPDERDVNALEKGLQIRAGRYQVLDAKNLDHYLSCVLMSRNLIPEFNNRLEEMRQAAVEERERRMEEAREARRKEIEEIEAERARMEEVWQEREERLLHEFLGEKGRIRTLGIKSYWTVEVAAREVRPSIVSEESQWIPYFEWTHPHYDEGKVKAIRSCRSFDIKVGSRYRVLWDDGEDDLVNPRDQSDVRAKRKRLKHVDEE